MIEKVLRLLRRFLYFTKKTKCPICYRAMRNVKSSEEELGDLIRRIGYYRVLLCTKCILFVKQPKEF